MQKWVKARDAADFSQFAPVLEEWVDLLKKYATAIDSSRPIYDVLLDDYEKGMTSARLEEIFTEVHCLHGEIFMHAFIVSLRKFLHSLHACHHNLERSKYHAE